MRIKDHARHCSQEDGNDNNDNDDEDNPVTGNGVTQASSCNLQSLTELLNMASDKDSTDDEGAMDNVDMTIMWRMIMLVPWMSRK